MRRMACYAVGLILVVAASASAQVTVIGRDIIQDAINALPGTGGTLHLLPHDYVLSETINVDRPVIFDCDPGVWISMPKLGFMFRVRSSGVRFIGAGFRCQQPGHCIHVLARDVPLEIAKHHRDWVFRDCVFDGTCLYAERVGRYTYDGQRQLIGSDLAGDVHIEHCQFRNAKTPAAIWLSGVDACTVRDCMIRDVGTGRGSGDGIKCTAGATDILITGTRIIRPLRDGIDLFDAGRVTISDCVLTDCGAHGIDAKFSESTHNDTRYHLVQSTRAERCAITGFSLDVDDVTCHGCVAIDCEDGYRNVRATGSSTRLAQRGIFVANRAVRCRRYGFYFGGEHVLATDNQAADCVTPYLVTAINSEIGSNL